MRLHAIRSVFIIQGALPVLLSWAMASSCQTNIVAVQNTGGAADTAHTAEEVTIVNASSAEATVGTSSGIDQFCGTDVPNGWAAASAVSSSGTSSQCDIIHTDFDGNTFEAICDGASCDCLLNGAIDCSSPCDNLGNPDCSLAICCPKAWGPTH